MTRDSVSDHRPPEIVPLAWVRVVVRRALQGAKFALLRVLAAVCEPMTRSGLAPAKRQVGILMFHRVAQEVPGAAKLTWNVTPELFRRQLTGLLRLGFVPWSLNDLLRALGDGKDLPPRVFVVTFDDGYANVHDYAWPILRDLKIPATVFLVTRYLDQNTPFPFDDWNDKGAPGVPADRWRPLSIPQVRAMMADPLIEFGSHTHLHRDYRDDPAGFARDLAESVAFLRTELGIERPAFAFPFGAKNDAMVSIARASGVRCALNSECVLTPARADPFLLGRFNVHEFETSKTLSLKLDGWYQWLKRRFSLQVTAR